ncbi:Rha family transcriptional regulator [Moritella viscosa]|uniref:DNA-binding protein n=1 Tax=Moritella viscosa TaxID=80854 RepID=A0A1L0ALE3_9GAMM|nr:Rha family transcriptional regulator [Moritella viscosa]SGZ16879.1 Putative uncharacterized protein [Moritella viscosa]
MANLIFHVDAPYVSKKRYAELTGLSIDTISKRIGAGKIPIEPKSSAKGLVLINMVALYKRADEQVF